MRHIQKDNFIYIADEFQIILQKISEFYDITDMQMQIRMLLHFWKSDFYNGFIIEIPWTIIFFLEWLFFSKWIHHLFDRVWCLGPQG